VHTGEDLYPKHVKLDLTPEQIEQLEQYLQDDIDSKGGRSGYNGVAYSGTKSEYDPARGNCQQYVCKVLRDNGIGFDYKHFRQTEPPPIEGPGLAVPPPEVQGPETPPAPSEAPAPAP
jgi:hypothetical protein